MKLLKIDKKGFLRLIKCISDALMDKGEWEIPIIEEKIGVDDDGSDIIRYRFE